MRKLKWKSDFDKSVVIENFVNRGWQKGSEKEDDNDWNVYWATVWTVRNIFNPKNGIRLNDNQILNHFPNHYELTRKDLMVKNMKRYKKELEKEFGKDEPLSINLDFVPQTYVLPGEYPLFVEEFHRNPNATWIVKPAARSQGQGIFLLRKIQQLKKISNNNQLSQTALNLKSQENYVISKYVDNPLLIGGKKFDLRMYVLVTNYRPLKAWIFNQGFGRFCNEQYSSDVAEMDNMFVHLTNVAIQQYSDKYSEKHGGKWSIQSLRFYVEQTYGTDCANKLFDDIHSIMINSLKSVQNVIINDKHCFEMYGYDILIDSNLKPWLLEINASPSLTTTTKTDKQLKSSLLHDVFKIVIPDDFQDQNVQLGNKVGGFTVLYDENQTEQMMTNNRKGKKKEAKIWK